MSNVGTDLADAVIVALNGQAFSQAFTATREYVPTHDVQDLSELTVEVMSTGKASELQTRNSLFETYRVAIAVQKVVANTDAAAVDPLTDLMQEISDFLAFKKLAGIEATWTGVLNDPLYEPEALFEQNTFFSVLHCTYKLGRKPVSN